MKSNDLLFCFFSWKTSIWVQSIIRPTCIEYFGRVRRSLLWPPSWASNTKYSKGKKETHTLKGGLIAYYVRTTTHTHHWTYAVIFQATRSHIFYRDHPEDCEHNTTKMQHLYESFYVHNIQNLNKVNTKFSLIFSVQRLRLVAWNFISIICHIFG